jgi:hypothetical protein
MVMLKYSFRVYAVMMGIHTTFNKTKSICSSWLNNSVWLTKPKLLSNAIYKSKKVFMLAPHCDDSEVVTVKWGGGRIDLNTLSKIKFFNLLLIFFFNLLFIMGFYKRGWINKFKEYVMPHMKNIDWFTEQGH